MLQTMLTTVIAFLSLMCVSACAQTSLPGGRLTLSNGSCVMTADVVAATTLYYAPCTGNTVPIYDGTTSFMLKIFTSSDTDTSGLVLSLGSNWSANTLYDVFVGMNGATVSLCTGPAWGNSGAGISSRSAGAGLALFKGIWTNAATLSCQTSVAAFSCPANQCTYLGTFLTSGIAGQVSFQFGTIALGGGAVQASVWNMYNRTPGAFGVFDSTGIWTVSAVNTYQMLDNSPTNRISFVTGMGDDPIDVTVSSAVYSLAATGSYISFGLNNTNAVWPRCFVGFNNGAVFGQGIGICRGNVPIGFNFLQALQFATSTSIQFQTNWAAPSTEGILATWWW